MKLAFYIIIGLFSLSIYGQSKEDSIFSKIHVEYKNSDSKVNDVAFLINGKNYPASLIRTLKPEIIDNIKIIEESDLYPKGAIDVEIDKSIIIEPLKLVDLIAKNVSVKTQNNIYLINDEPIDIKASDYYVDKNNILNIVVNKVNNADLEYSVIRIYTKTEKNISTLKNMMKLK